MEEQPARREGPAATEVAGPAVASAGAVSAADGLTVRTRVAEVIDGLGCSRREFARRIVMDPSKLSRSLGGTRRFTIAEVVRIADAGGVDPGWLLGGPGGTPAREAVAERAAGRPARATPPAEGRPLQIVRETVRLIAEQGFHAVRVSDIATACGTSTAAIHYHYPGRDELLEAAVRWCMDEDIARRAVRAGEGTDARTELLRLIALQTPRTERQRRQWLVWLDLWAEAARSTEIGRLHADFYRQWRATLADVLRRGRDEGVFRPDLDPAGAALRLAALIDGLATQVLAVAPDSTTPDDMHAVLTAYVDTALTAP
ncbi:TetR family transcriptional regulator C-terminal domain-containing protein [Streptomyces sp. NPDC057702]|uniref:TetR family transcriptional regulator C-terminal domain-containing protein n=1 Tax=unclassified Streptomyces TaxID=2593676 RepID=UPI0036774ACD